jgi:glycerophosphoryl diester phosphodiesterase
VGIDVFNRNKRIFVLKPKVIAHRGACGYRPENTLEAFELGLAQGADGIEFDLVNTADGVLVIRHENALSETTDIEQHPEFSAFKRDGIVSDRARTDWFSEDMSLQEIKTLRAIERMPDLRPGSAKFDSKFEVPSFEELLGCDFIKDKIVVVEIKPGTHTKVLTQHIGRLTAQNIAKSNVIARPVELVIESFDAEILMDAKAQLEIEGIPAQYFFAIDSTKIVDCDLKQLAADFDGLSIATHMLLSSDTWVKSCHELGLQVWVYTARAEKATTTIEAYYEELIQTGVDGIFADQPDLLRRVLDERG